MKKILAVLVLLTVFAGAAFAQMSIGAEVFAHVIVASGSNKDNDDVIGNGYGFDRLRLSVSGQNEDGTVGGWMRIEPTALAFFNYDWSNVDFSDADEVAEAIAEALDGRHGWAGKAWYQPIDMVRLTIGSNGGDGEFALEGITGWGFYGLPCEISVVNPGSTWGWGPGNGPITNFRKAFYGGWNAPGAFLTITPPQVEELEINFAVPYSRAEDAYHSYIASTLQATYVIDGIGKAGVTVDGFNFDEKGGDGATRLYGYFNLTAVENLSVDIGVGANLTKSKNVAVGVGATYSMDDFGVNFRAMIDLYLPESGDGYQWLLVDVLPYYAVNETITAFLSFGIGKGLGDTAVILPWGAGDPAKDYKLAWHLYPYIKVSTGWAQDFYAGLRLESPWNEDGKIFWSIPMGITIGF